MPGLDFFKNFKPSKEQAVKCTQGTITALQSTAVMIPATLRMITAPDPLDRGQVISGLGTALNITAALKLLSNLMDPHSLRLLSTTQMLTIGALTLTSALTYAYSATNFGNQNAIISNGAETTGSAVGFETANILTTMWVSKAKVAAQQAAKDSSLLENEVSPRSINKV